MPIGGGYAVWTEDVSALLAIKEESECLAEELAERNEILRYEYRRESKRRKVEEQTDCSIYCSRQHKNRSTAFRH